MRIISPIATGNGAYVLHKTLEKEFSNYCVAPYNPWWTLVPFVLPFFTRGKANIIHSTADYAYFFSCKKIPLVVTLHNYVLDPFMRPYSSLLQNIHYQSDLKWFIKKSLLHADKVTSVSQFTAQLSKKHLKFDGDIQVIPNGIDTKLFYPQHQKTVFNKIKVLFSGNLTRRKGAQWLPKIAGLLSENIELLYTQGLNKTNLILTRDNMRCIGTVPYHEMSALYNEVDMLLLPTVREGMSLAVLEAMACGLPIITSDCSSMPELIDQGKGGYLCEIGNCEIFASRINELAENSQLRRDMGLYNRSKIEKKFTLELMIQAYQSMFETVLL